MAFTKVTKDMGIISALADKPNDVGGLTAAQLKAKFDEAGAALKDYLNNVLTAELEAAGGAGNIGIQSIGTLAATTVQAALEALHSAITEAHEPVDGSVTTAKLAANAVTTDKLLDNSVTATKIKDGEVGANELAANAVATAKIVNGAVTTDKLAGAAVTNQKLASEAVGTDNLKSDLLVPVSKGGTGSTTAEAARQQLGAQGLIQNSSFSLTVAGWTARTGGGYTQTVTVTGLTANSMFVASPSNEAGWKVAQDANLFPPTAGAGTLTFTCEELPADAITVTVYFW